VLLKKYAKNQQLELPLESNQAGCPECFPSGDPKKDLFRGLCPYHIRELDAYLNSDEGRAEMEAALEQGRKDAEAYRNSVPMVINSGLRFR